MSLSLNLRSLALGASAAIPTFLVLFVLVTALLETLIWPSAIVGFAVALLGGAAVGIFVYTEFSEH